MSVVADVQFRDGPPVSSEFIIFPWSVFTLGKKNCQNVELVEDCQPRLNSVSADVDPAVGSCGRKKIKSHLVRTQSLNVLPLKPGVGQYIATPAMLTAREFFLISTLLVHSLAFFPKPLPIFPVLAVANTWFLCRPAE